MLGMNVERKGSAPWVQKTKVTANTSCASWRICNRETIPVSSMIPTMIELLRKATTQARDDGYTALRVTGDMSWALQDVVGGDRLLEYESQLNEFYPGSDALSICQYDRRRFSAEMILQVLQAHPTVIIGTQFARNAYHIPPNEMHSQQLATYRLNRWLRNIQDLKAERQAREQTERELRSALDEKEQLLRELNHRVKNSLLMVSSLMSLKERTSRAPQDLTEVKTFVNTIQLIHDKLYQADDMEHVAFAPYLRELLADIVSLFPGPEVQLDIDVPDVALPTSPAVNLGLILNELTTNALKYGFEEVSVPRITVALVWEDDHREYVLTFSNNGPPLPERFNLRALPTGGLGTQLIRSFVEKMDGSIEVQRAPHPQFTIRFSA